MSGVVDLAASTLHDPWMNGLSGIPCVRRPLRTLLNIFQTGPGSKSGNTRLSKAGFSKMPVSSILVLGVSNPHHHKGDRHGRPSYVLVLVHAIRPRSGRRTAQPPSLAGPEAATPGAAGSGYPSARWSSTSLRLGPGT